MNICIISGSARKDNNTIRLAYALKRILEKRHRVSIVDFIKYDIPLVPQGDIDPHSLSTFQKQLIDEVGQANLVFLISPEYNWSTTPEVLNMLHRLADNDFQHIFDNTVFALMGVSTGKGGK